MIKQPLMVRTFLKVYMELGSYFLFLQEQIKDIIITTSHRWCGRAGRESHDSKANNDKGSPRLQSPDHISTLVMQ